MTSPAYVGLGRAAATVAERICQEIEEGRATSGQFLPPVRELAGIHSVGSKTIWRALKALEAEGLIAAEPRQGYRVLPGAGVPLRGCPLAYVAGGRPEDWIGSTDRLLGSLREAAERRGWSLLAVGCAERDADEVLEQLRAARTFGVALDTQDPEVMKAVRDSRVPAVMLNAWIPDSGLDSVMQDGQLGGMLAARYLIEQGCRRIAYFGRCNPEAHSADRFSGAAAGIATAGLNLEPGMIVRVTSDDAAEKARALLSGDDPPDGIIAPYHGSSRRLAGTVREMGLELGRDVRVVGWCPEELYESEWFHPLKDGPVPPVITWSVSALAETALARLVERRANPEQPPLRVKVPTWLKFAGGK